MNERATVDSILDGLGLSAGQIEKRKGALGGSDANTIMSGRDDRLIALWREKRGEKEPDSLDDILAVQMGSYTEPFNVAWFEKNTGRTVVRPAQLADQGSFAGPHSFMRCTVDGIVAATPDLPEALFEAKHTGTRSTDAEIFARYVPQLTHNALCIGARTAFLSAFKGNGDWIVMEYDLDDDYAARLIDAEAAFWECVRTGEPPCAVPAEPTPKPVGVVEIDMTPSNAWASLAGEYRETMLAAERHAFAKNEIKALVPPEASKCFGHGLTVKRDKRGALRFANAGEES